MLHLLETLHRNSVNVVWITGDCRARKGTALASTIIAQIIYFPVIVFSNNNPTSYLLTLSLCTVHPWYRYQS